MDCGVSLSPTCDCAGTAESPGWGLGEGGTPSPTALRQAQDGPGAFPPREFRKAGVSPARLAFPERMWPSVTAMLGVWWNRATFLVVGASDRPVSHAGKAVAAGQPAIGSGMRVGLLHQDQQDLPSAGGALPFLVAEVGQSQDVTAKRVTASYGRLHQVSGGYSRFHGG